MPVTGATQVHWADIATDSKSLRIAGTMLYALSGTAQDGTFTVVDIADPANLVVRGTIVGAAALVNARGVTERTGDIVCVVGHETFACINVANPAAPAIVGSLVANNSYFGEVSCTRIGDHVFSVGNNLTATNVANPAAPAVVSNVDTAIGNGMARGVLDLGGGLVAVTVSTSSPYYVGIYNVANPAAMALVGSVALDPSLSWHYGMARHPTLSLLYVPCAGLSDGTGRGLAVVDFSTPAAPVVRWFETTALHPLKDCKVTADATSLVVGGLNVIRFYDLAAPAAPSFVAQYQRDDQPMPLNKNLLDGNAYPVSFAINDTHAFGVGDAIRVVSFVLKVVAAAGGWPGGPQNQWSVGQLNVR